MATKLQYLHWYWQCGFPASRGECTASGCEVFLFLFVAGIAGCRGFAAAPHLCCCRVPDPERLLGGLVVGSVQLLFQITVPSAGVLQPGFMKYSAFGDDKVEACLWLVPSL